MLFKNSNVIECGQFYALLRTASLQTQSRSTVRTPTHCEPASHERLDSDSMASSVGSAFHAASTSASGNALLGGGCPGAGGEGGGAAARADFTPVQSFANAEPTSLGNVMFEPIADSTVGSRERLK